MLWCYCIPHVTTNERSGSGGLIFESGCDLIGERTRHPSCGISLLIDATRVLMTKSTDVFWRCGRIINFPLRLSFVVYRARRHAYKACCCKYLRRIRKGYSKDGEFVLNLNNYAWETGNWEAPGKHAALHFDINGHVTLHTNKIASAIMLDFEAGGILIEF